MAFKHTIGHHKPKLSIKERKGRFGLYIFWWEGKRRRHYRLHGIDTVHRPDGRIDPAAVVRASALAMHQYAAITGAEDGMGSEALVIDPSRLTLREGFQLVLRVPGGKYPTTTPQWKDMDRASGRVTGILGGHRVWSELRSKDYTAVWRSMAQNTQDTGLGPRMAEQTIQLLQAASNWLHRNDYTTRAPQAPKGWRQELKKDWTELTGDSEEAIQPSRPRYTAEETKKIFSVLPEADPRIRLAIEIGAEYRMGQVLRVRRSGIELGEAGETTLLRIPGAGRKPGAKIALTQTQDDTLRDAIGASGHLADLEEAYRGGEISDYPLFPAGELVKGRIAWDGKTLMNRRTALAQFYAVEKAAGVEPIDGRGWYGLRRGFSDLTRVETTDERVRDAAGGWTTGSETRSRIYMDPNDLSVIEEAARVRRKVRTFAEKPMGEDAPSRKKAELLEAEGVSPERIAEVLRQLEGL